MSVPGTSIPIHKYGTAVLFSNTFTFRFYIRYRGDQDHIPVLSWHIIFPAVKRLLVTILSLVYLITATGTTLHLHYCMGKLTGLSLWSSPGKVCPKCGMEKSDSLDAGCCKDEQKHVQLKDAHTQAIQTNAIAPLAPILLTSHFFLIGTYTRPITVISYQFFDTPLRSEKAPVYLQNGVFLI